MIIKRTFRFEKLTDWNHEIDVSANSFHEKFNVWPNILMTNEPTFRRIDFLANRKQENIRNAGMKIEDKLFVSLGGYDSKRYHLDFYTNWQMPDNSFSLISGEPIDTEPLPEDMSYPRSMFMPGAAIDMAIK